MLSSPYRLQAFLHEVASRAPFAMARPEWRAGALRVKENARRDYVFDTTRPL
jgi:hypothetical protein